MISGKQANNVFQTYYPGNYQPVPISDPRIRFYNSSAENENRPKLDKEPYYLTQSMGNASQPVKRPDAKDQR